MLRIGFHVSISDSINKSVDRAQKLGCTTFQIFTRNPRSWIIRPLSDSDVSEFRRKLKLSRIKPVFSHMPYISNLTSPDKTIWIKSVNSLIEEVYRCDQLGIPYIVIHLGSHMGLGLDFALKQITRALESGVSNGKATILLENSSGSGNHYGNTFEELRSIIDEINDQRIGVCFDTCHAYASGYNLATKDGFNNSLNIIEKTLGLKHVKLVHLNDSKDPLGSRIDRHEHIGLGQIGDEGFRRILKSNLKKIPIVMETPIDEHLTDVDNMKKVKSLLNQTDKS